MPRSREAFGGLLAGWLSTQLAGIDSIVGSHVVFDNKDSSLNAGNEKVDSVRLSCRGMEAVPVRLSGSRITKLPESYLMFLFFALRGSHVRFRLKSLFRVRA